jgi:hypothetical protein
MGGYSLNFLLIHSAHLNGIIISLWINSLQLNIFLWVWMLLNKLRELQLQWIQFIVCEIVHNLCNSIIIMHE